MRNVLFLSAIWIFISVISLKADDNMKAFPPPENGQLRYILQLPSLDTESNCKVELIVGKIVEIDTHEELVAKDDGHYSKLWDLQKGGFE